MRSSNCSSSGGRSASNRYAIDETGTRGSCSCGGTCSTIGTKRLTTGYGVGYGVATEALRIRLSIGVGL